MEQGNQIPVDENFNSFIRSINLPSHLKPFDSLPRNWGNSIGFLNRSSRSHLTVYISS
jgi:hypothetical protein